MQATHHVESGSHARGRQSDIEARTRQLGCEDQAAAKRHDALLQGARPDILADKFGKVERALERKSDAVVSNDDPDPPGIDLEVDADSLGESVPAHVGQTLLNDMTNVSGEARRQRAGRGRPQLGREAVLVLDPATQPA